MSYTEHSKCHDDWRGAVSHESQAPRWLWLLTSVSRHWAAAADDDDDDDVCQSSSRHWAAADDELTWLEMTWSHSDSVERGTAGRCKDVDDVVR